MTTTIRPTRNRAVLLSALALAFVAGSGSGPVAAATSTMEHVHGAVDFTFDNPCTGETIQVNGELNFFIHRVVDSDGNTRVTLHQNNSQLSGVGLTTGTNYQLQTVATRVQIFPEDTEPTFVSHLNVISQGSDVNAVLQQTVQVRTDAEGGQFLQVFNQFLKCQ
jgi:hypothetical protein